MNEIQNVRILMYLIAMLISGCAIIWQEGNRSLGNRSRPAAAILIPIFLSSVVSVFISMFAVDEPTQHLILNMSLTMPFDYMIVELLCVHDCESGYESESRRKRIFYDVAYFLGVAAGLIPYWGTRYFPLDVTMGAAVFLQLYCLALQMRRWADFMGEPKEK